MKFRNESYMGTDLLMKYNNRPSIFEEIREIIRFFKSPKSEREIVFYTEHSGYWPIFEGLVNELVRTHNKTIVYVTSGWNDPILAEKDVRITTLYISKLMPLFAQLVDSKVFVITLSDLNNHYLKRSRHLVHYVYVFHAMVSTHMVYNLGAFDHYDSMLCVGPHQLKEIEKQEELYKLKPKKLVEAGYYRLEKIMDEFRKYKKEETGKISKNVLIAPSWGDENILETCGHDLVELCLSRGYNVTVRPHSETLKRFPEIIGRIEREFGNKPNFKLEKSNATNNSIIAADVLISDCSGIVLEYAFGTERPVVFIDVPLKIKNKRYQELGLEPLELSLRTRIGKIVSPKSLESLPVAIENLEAEKEAYKKEITELRGEYVFNLGYSSKVGAEYILNLLL